MISNSLGWGWCTLLREHPNLAEDCPWDRLDGDDWSWLLREQPQFADKCDWDKLSGWDWCELLLAQPRFAEYCRWGLLDQYDMQNVIDTQPFILDELSSEGQIKAVTQNRLVFQYLTNPTDMLIRLHKMKHEL